MTPVCRDCLTQDEAADLRLSLLHISSLYYALARKPWPICARCTARASVMVPDSWHPEPV